MYDQKRKSLKFDAFRENLNMLMNSKRMRRSDLSEAIGCQRGTITRYLSQERDPDIEFVYRISQFFGVSFDWILGLSENKFSARYSPEMKKLMELYILAEESDQLVIRTILSKYDKEAQTGEK